MSMKVFNLACRHDHRFEGWFASSAAFDDQQSRRLIECPICSDHEIVKMPAAPRLNLSQKPRKADSREGRPQSVPPPAANGSPVEAGDGSTPIDHGLDLARDGTAGSGVGALICTQCSCATARSRYSTYSMRTGT